MRVGGDQNVRPTPAELGLNSLFYGKGPNSLLTGKNTRNIAGSDEVSVVKPLPKAAFGRNRVGSPHESEQGVIRELTEMGIS